MDQMRNTSIGILTMALSVPLALSAQERLKAMPGYEAAQRVAREAHAIAGAVSAVAWTDPRTFEYDRDGKRYRYDVARQRSSEIDRPKEVESAGERSRGSILDAP